MKTEKYELLQWFPGLPDEWCSGDIISAKKMFGQARENYYENKRLNRGFFIENLPGLDAPVKYSKWWRKIENFKILKVKTQSGCYITFNESGKPVFRTDDYSIEATPNLKTVLEKVNYTIQTVQRESDNSCFSVGNKCIHFGAPYRITKFKLVDDEIKVYLKGIIIELNLNDIKPVEDELFSLIKFKFVNGVIITYNKNGEPISRIDKVSIEKTADLKLTLENEYAFIFSVIRPSDKKEIIVGDRLKVKIDPATYNSNFHFDSKNENKITVNEIIFNQETGQTLKNSENDATMPCAPRGIYVRDGHWYYEINHVQPVDPLLTTFDGKKIYENVEICIVDKTTFKIINPKISAKQVVKNVENEIYFSSEKDAQEWIYYNEPIFSRKEMQNFLKKDTK